MAMRYFQQMTVAASAYSVIAIPLTKVLNLLGVLKVSCEEIEDLEGRVIIVTGANTGIGKAVARQLAENGATVVLACRSMDRANEAVRDIISTISARKSLTVQQLEQLRKRVVVMHLDLSDLASVRAFASSFSKQFRKLDVLVNNAGLAVAESTLTKQGIEQVFGANFVGHFLLTNLLVDLLKSSDDGRIVNLSSVMHHIATTNILPVITGEKRIGGYKNSKLAMLLFTLELRRRLADTRILATAVNPGFVASDIWRHIKGQPMYSRIWTFLTSLFALSVDQGAAIVLAAAAWPRPRLPRRILSQNINPGDTAVYLQPYYLPLGPRRALPFEILGPFAGPRPGWTTLPRDEPRQSAEMWRLTEELCARSSKT